MASEKQIAANRANAKKSTGPKTAAGRSKSSRNALRHGLSAPLRLDPVTSVKAAAIAQALVDSGASEEQLASAAEFAGAHLELLRICALRHELAASIHLCPSPQALHQLAALDRYERYAHTRRRQASRKLQGQGQPG